MKSRHIIFGLTTGIAVAIFFLVSYKTGLYASRPNSQLLFTVIFGIGLLGNGIVFSNENNREVAFGQIFTNCFKAGLIAALCWVAYDVFSEYAFPEIKQSLIDNLKTEKITHAAKMTDEQIEKNIVDIQKHHLTMMIEITLFWSLILSAISSLLAGLVAPKRKV